MKPIEDRLRETIGLDAASVGPSMIQRAIRQRMRSLGLKRPADYRQFLEQSRAEWQELVESVVVTETWFFRDPEPIAAFVRLVREEWLPAHAIAPLRLLSVPCSSGEEPFSLAMALLDAGVSSERFQIEAVDISARALARAARGVYGKNSFREKNLVFRDLYFQPCKEGQALDSAVRKCVRFCQGNFLSDDFLAGQASYDFIFCRNLLIYFDPLMRRKALGKIERLLTPAGVLFVGPVEQPLAIEHGFVRARTLVKREAVIREGNTRRPRPSVWLSKRSLAFPGPHLKGEFQPWLVKREDVMRKGSTLKREPRTSRLTDHVSRVSSLGTDLETARRLADAGRLKAAAEICEAHLRENRVSAPAHYLLGLVRDASGEPGAIDCYRRALYLEPNHYESLLQMAQLLQKNGEAARARTFKSRAQRIGMEI